MNRLLVSSSVLMSFLNVLAVESADVYAVPVVSNFVATGETSAYAEDARYTAGTTILKAGGGTLVLPASETGFAPPAFQVREGAVEYRNDLAAARVADRQTKDRENVRIGRGAHVGNTPETAADPEDWGIAVLGPGTVIAPGETVAAKTMLDKHHS